MGLLRVFDIFEKFVEFFAFQGLSVFETEELTFGAILEKADE